MSAYLMFSFDVSDQATYSAYVAQVGPMLGRYGAEVLVVSHDPRVLEGEPPGMHVVLRFDSEDKAMEFYESDDYAPVKALRLKSTSNHSCVLAPGFMMPGG